MKEARKTVRNIIPQTGQLQSEVTAIIINYCLVTMAICEELSHRRISVSPLSRKKFH